MDTAEQVGFEDPQEEIENDAAIYDDVITSTFTITSYGADYTVDGVVKRMRSKAFYVPPFQREFVWNIKQSSRFIESLLLGLPVPGIFVFKETETNRSLIVDGQQRLTSLRRFYDEIFDDAKSDDAKSDHRVFALEGVGKQWEGKTYSQLDPNDQLKLDDSIIHTTVFQQDSPEDDRSIYEVFERINTGGIKLSHQEIRACVSYGKLNELIQELDKYPAWRKIFGKPNKRLKDQEFILRFFAFAFARNEYEPPFRGFLDNFLRHKRNPSEEILDKFTAAFCKTVDLVVLALGERPFRPSRNLNAAVFDSCMVGIWERLKLSEVEPSSIKASYDNLLQNNDFLSVIGRSTAAETAVSTRLNLAINAFKNA